MVALAPAVHAQQNITLASPVHTRDGGVTVGKTEDVRTDQNFANITVGDPDIADVSPLTDHSLSILGKKIGTTRVTVYDADHKPVGIFDVEVSYDISRLAAEIGHFTGGGIKVSSINGRIMLSGTSPDAATLDKAVQIARPVRPGSDQYGPGHAAAADRAGGALHRSRPQCQPRSRRAVERVRQFRPCQYRLRAAGVAAADHAAGWLLPAAGQPRVGGPNVAANALPISPVVSAGVLSGAAPFGFLVGQLTQQASDRGQCARIEGRRAAPGGAESGDAVGRDRELPRRRTNSDPGSRRHRHAVVRLPALRRRPVLHPDRAAQRRDQPHRQAGSERDRHDAMP